MIPLAQAQLLVEGFRGGLATKEVLKRLHLILSTATFKNSMSVTSTFLAVHRVLLKDGVEHIGRVDLRREVAVVASIVASDQVSESGLTVTPVETFTQRLRPIERTDLLAEAVVKFAHLEILDLIVGLAFVHSHIEDTEVELTEVEECIVDVTGADDTVDQIVRQGLGRLLGVWLGLLVSGLVVF